MTSNSVCLFDHIDIKSLLGDDAATLVELTPTERDILLFSIGDFDDVNDDAEKVADGSKRKVRFERFRAIVCDLKPSRRLSRAT